MSDSDVKVLHLAAAQGRIDFWTIWSREAATPECRTYFTERLRHWQHVFNAVEMTPCHE